MLGLGIEVACTMRSMLRSSGGMTLVESLVAAVMSMVVASVLLTISISYNNEMRACGEDYALSGTAIAVSERVGRNARMAHRIIDAADQFREECTDDADTVDSALFYDAFGAVFAGIKMDNGVILERVSPLSSEWRRFSIGNKEVLVDDSSRIILNGCGNGITLELKYIRHGTDMTYKLTPQTEYFRCCN